jgi:predicted PurR-regulated permease PerM
MSTVSPDPPRVPTSPPWGTATKIIVVVFTLLLFTLIAWRFQSLIGSIIIAAILAYLLDPLISFVQRRTQIKRVVIIGAVYLVLVAAIIGGFFALGLASFQQVTNLINLTPDLIVRVTESIQDFLNQTESLQFGPLEISPSQVPWDRLVEQLLGLAQPVLSQSGTIVSRFATTTARTVINIIFVVVLSIYLSTDLPRLSDNVKKFAQLPGYRADAERLLPELRRVWGAYLRGQIVLAFVIFLMVWTGLTILGVQNALALALLAGLLEFIPNLGPVISTIVTIIVAVFQSSNYMGLSPVVFALVILAMMILIQQLENHLLVPRIVGHALNLHPIIVILGVVMGASLAGILGAVLAAPIIASLKVLGEYAGRKLFDLPPFAEHEPPPESGSAATGEEVAPAAGNPPAQITTSD